MAQDLHRAPTIGSGRGHVDPLELPYGTVADGANLDEFVTETKPGNIVKPVKSNVTGKEEDYNLVTFTIGRPREPEELVQGLQMVVYCCCGVHLLRGGVCEQCHHGGPGGCC